MGRKKREQSAQKVGVSSPSPDLRRTDTRALHVANIRGWNAASRQPARCHTPPDPGTSWSSFTRGAPLRPQPIPSPSPPQADILVYLGLFLDPRIVLHFFFSSSPLSFPLPSPRMTSDYHECVCSFTSTVHTSRIDQALLLLLSLSVDFSGFSPRCK